MLAMVLLEDQAEVNSNWRFKLKIIHDITEPIAIEGYFLVYTKDNSWLCPEDTAKNLDIKNYT